MITSLKRSLLTLAVVSCLPGLQLAAQQRPATQNRNYAELLKRFDRNGDGRLDGATDPRSDGQVAAW